MSDLSMTVDVENIKKMDTFPNRDGMMSAEEVKAQFDKAPADIKKHINEVLVPAIEDTKGKAHSAVQFTEQTLKKEEQEQARANISAAKNTAVLYETQTLSEEQKAEARANIGAAKNTAVLYTAQDLTESQKDQAQRNIGAASKKAVDFLVAKFSQSGLRLSDQKTSEGYVLYVENGKLKLEKE